MRRLRLGCVNGASRCCLVTTRSAQRAWSTTACKRAGIEAEIPKDIFRALWQKYVLLVAVSGMTTAGRLPMRTLIAEPEGLATAISCMAEVAAVGCAQGIDLPGDLSLIHI